MVKKLIFRKNYNLIWQSGLMIFIFIWGFTPTLITWIWFGAYCDIASSWCLSGCTCSTSFSCSGCSGCIRLLICFASLVCTCCYFSSSWEPTFCTNYTSTINCTGTTCCFSKFTCWTYLVKTSTYCSCISCGRLSSCYTRSTFSCRGCWPTA